MEFHDHIGNHYEKYIEISTNMPVIDSLIHEITVQIAEMWERNTILLIKSPRSEC